MKVYFNKRIKILIILLFLTISSYAMDFSDFLLELHDTQNYLNAISYLETYSPQDLLDFLIEEEKDIELYAIGTIGLYVPGLDESNKNLIELHKIEIRNLSPFGCLIFSGEEEKYRTLRREWVERYNILVLSFL